MPAATCVMMGPVDALTEPQAAPVGPGEGWAGGVARFLLRNRSLLERVGELRTRLFRMALAVLVASVLAWFAYGHILVLLVQPLKSLPGASGLVKQGTLVFTAPTEAFYVRIRVVVFTGAAVASPVVLWQLWGFLAAGVRTRGTRYAVAVVASAVVLFLAGGALAFAFVNPALRLFVYLGGSHVTLIPSAGEYLSFLMLLVVAFGLTFEYPLFLLALTLAGVISSGHLRRRRRIAYFSLLVVSAVVTPTVDPITPLALALPLGLLYEATIAVARLLKR